MLDHPKYPATSGDSPLTVALREQERRMANISRFHVPSDEAVRESLAERVAQRIAVQACMAGVVRIGCGEDLRLLVKAELLAIGT